MTTDRPQGSEGLAEHLRKSFPKWLPADYWPDVAAEALRYLSDEVLTREKIKAAVISQSLSGGKMGGTVVADPQDIADAIRGLIQDA